MNKGNYWTEAILGELNLRINMYELSAKTIDAIKSHIWERDEYYGAYKCQNCQGHFRVLEIINSVNQKKEIDFLKCEDNIIKGIIE